MIFNDLKYTSHIKNKFLKANRSLGMLRRGVQSNIKPFILTLYISLVRPQ